MAILIAIVSMNIRHAWMNYGIAENKILAGVAADSMQKDKPTPCDTKFTYQVVEPDRKEIPETVLTRCIIRVETLYFEIGISGKKYPVATVIYDLSTEKTTVKYEGKMCCYENLPHETTYVKDYLDSEKVRCDIKYTKGVCCYPHEAETDCSVLVKNLRTT